MEPMYVILPYKDDRQTLVTDLDLFRSVQWNREGVTASGVFDNRINT